MTDNPMTPSRIQAWLDNNLLRVTKPGRYVGGELNQIVKPWIEKRTTFALAFPDIYDIGASNLGMAILYDTLNQREDVLAERVYAPWLDMETLMRANDIPLFSLESKSPINTFEIFGITIPYETLYTNVLNLLDIAQIPIYSRDRKNTDPLVVAGGQSTFNPEPMADFIDVFVIGEGEEIIHEIVDEFQQWKFDQLERDELLKRLCRIWGIYIPAFYKPTYQYDGTVHHMDRLSEAAPESITKRIVAELPPPPTKLIVPSIDIVHNRLPIEIMRGCSRGCRFCHAGMVNLPVRQRSPEQILATIKKAYLSTGMEEIGLLSLSSSDHTEIQHLVNEINHNFPLDNLNISLPSLRIETFSIDLMDSLQGKRHGGFTLAPEAGSERMRNTINKPITPGRFLDTVTEIYRRGWQTIKLYFMIGQPGETDEDLDGIIDLCMEAQKIGRAIVGRNAKLHVSIGTLIPKPHTPFQWVATDTVEMIQQKQDRLRHALKKPGIKLMLSDPRATMLEAWLSRGDRRTGAVIYTAWQNGAKFDAWQDQYNFQIWKMAFEHHALDPSQYAHRMRELDDILPWDHISTGVKKSFLVREYQNSQKGVVRRDCREQCYACGIQSTYMELVNPNDIASWQCQPVTKSRSN